MIERVFQLTPGIVAKTQAHLREKGRAHQEGVALWRGTFEPPRVTAVIIPRQETGAGRFRVPLSERQRIARELAGSGEVIVAQVHSHPRAAFHSATDDDEAIPRRVGAYSLVIPDFGSRPNLLECAALFQLGADGAWEEAPLETFRLPTLAPAKPKKLAWLIAALKKLGRSRT